MLRSTTQVFIQLKKPFTWQYILVFHPEASGFSPPFQASGPFFGLTRNFLAPKKSTVRAMCLVTILQARRVPAAGQHIGLEIYQHNSSLAVDVVDLSPTISKLPQFDDSKLLDFYWDDLFFIKFPWFILISFILLSWWCRTEYKIKGKPNVDISNAVWYGPSSLIHSMQRCWWGEPAYQTYQRPFFTQTFHLHWVPKEAIVARNPSVSDPEVQSQPFRVMVRFLTR